MQVILHTGVHCTDDDKLLRVLLRNTHIFRADGIAVPGPSRYRTLLTEAAAALHHGRAAPDARDILLDTFLDDDPDQVKRVVLSHENLFAVPKLALAGGRLYRKAETRLGAMAELFKGDQLELFIGLRNPATWLPAMYAATPHPDFSDFMQGNDPMRLRWSELIRRIRAALPKMQITLWCNEDTPLIWGQLLRQMAGVEPGRKITGAFDMLQQIMSPEGMKRFRTYLKDNPDISERQKRRVMIAFLDKYAIPDAMEQELDLPGWDDAYVDMLTELYEDDVHDIGRMTGVTLLTP